MCGSFLYLVEITPLTEIKLIFTQNYQKSVPLHLKCLPKSTIFVFTTKSNFTKARSPVAHA